MLQQSLTVNINKQVHGFLYIKRAASNQPQNDLAQFYFFNHDQHVPIFIINCKILSAMLTFLILNLKNIKRNNQNVFYSFLGTHHL